MRRAEAISTMLSFWDEMGDEQDRGGGGGGDSYGCI